jgi:hypothetical protein
VAVIDFGGKPRTLKFDLAAIRDLETALDGRPLATVIGDITRIGVTATTAALWAGLKHEDKTLNINLVTKMLERHLSEGKGLRTLARAIDAALEETGLFKTDEDDDVGNGPAAEL